MKISKNDWLMFGVATVLPFGLTAFALYKAYKLYKKENKTNENPIDFNDAITAEYIRTAK
jgi:hypothetical protein